MLLIPEVSKTFSELCPRCVGEHARIASILLRVIVAKRARRESPSLLWISIVAKEIRWSYKYRRYLTWCHQQTVADLLEWYCSQGAEYEDEWLTLFPDNQRSWRMARAALDWYSAHVTKLSSRQLCLAMDLLEDFCADNPHEFYPRWSCLCG